MASKREMADLIEVMKRIEQKVELLEAEMVVVKSYLGEDRKLSPAEKKLVEESIRKVKADDLADTISLEDLKKKVGA